MIRIHIRRTDLLIMIMILTKLRNPYANITEMKLREMRCKESFTFVIILLLAGTHLFIYFCDRS